MPHAERDGVQLYFEDTGEGAPILFLHEYGGDHRSWRLQVDHFARTHRCVVTSARGYPPSAVPDDEASYGQDHAIADAFHVLDHLRIDSAVVVGLSMGAYTALRMALMDPARVQAVVAASGGSGSFLATRDGFLTECTRLADKILEDAQGVADAFSDGPTRTQLKRKDPAMWTEFRDNLREHPATGASLTMRCVQGRRPSLMDFEAAFAACTVPTLLMIGDEDEAVIDLNVWLKRVMPSAGLLAIPKSGHLLNLEDPMGFNDAVERFLEDVAAGDWPLRDAMPGGFGGVGPAFTDE